MKKKTVNIIGLGEIGFKTLEAMTNTTIYGDKLTKDALEFYATDVDPTKAEPSKRLGCMKFSNKPFKKCDVYIICVWSSDQILDVLKQIRSLNRNREYIVSIESTLDPSKTEEVLTGRPINETLAAFPHRYMAGDKQHGIFNQNRVLGVSPILEYVNVEDFYSPFFPQQISALYMYGTEGPTIIRATFENAVLSKIIENSYRYMEIVLAQELSLIFGAEWFEQLRRLANTKWNINIKEAKDGVKGKCLPKDMELLGEYPKALGLVELFKTMNETYMTMNRGIRTIFDNPTKGPQF